MRSGERLGRYTVVSLLGAGGMGSVYRATDTSLGRDVALKVLPPEMAGDPERLERFRREARAVAALNHPHIVTIHSIEHVEGVHFLTMELLSGETLEKVIAGRPLPIDRAVSIARQVADALAAAHDKHLVHRDLKPANVMVGPGDLVKVLDFGLAKTHHAAEPAADAETTQAATHVGTVLGTPNYMSPEQVAGQEVDHRTDIFSLGVMIYEMLTGSRLFRGRSAAELAAAILRDAPPPLEVLRPDAPAALVRALEKCLEKSPSARFDTMVAARDALHAPPGAAAAEAAPPGTSVAVLPFQNLSADPENEYFCDGLAEELLSALARLPGLRVASRTSAFMFRGKDLDIQTIGERLRVGAVVEGSVRRAGSRLRITAQLVKVSNGFQLWSERFDRTLDDVFVIQEEIAQAIVDRLKVTLGPTAGQPIVPRHTDNREAYHLYLRGRFYWAKRFEGGLTKAMECFEQAIAADPHYGLAHAGVADAFAMLGFYSLLPPRPAFARAREAAGKALAIDGQLAEAHASMALVRLGADFDVEGARDELAFALRLDPRLASPRIYLSWVLVLLGRVDDAMAEARRALDDDPMSQTVLSGAGYTSFLARRYDEAIQMCDRCLELGAGFLVALYIKGMALGQLGRFAEAVAVLEEAATLSNRAPFYIGLLGTYYARMGRRAEAEAILAEVQQAPPGRHVPAHVHVNIHARLGDLDAAFRWQDKACEEGAPPFNFLTPALDVLFADPRHLEHLRRMGATVDLRPYLSLPAPAPA